MLAEGGRVALSYNGEIYNYRDLRDDLARRGWQFATASDSETVLASYCLDGVEGDANLNGMYAHAILDERTDERAIVLAVDPVGIKPMFVWQGAGVVLFASELQAIVAALRALAIPVEIDREAAASFLKLGWVPAPLAMIRGARRLLPGERWRIDVAEARAAPLSVRPLPASARPSANREEFVERFGAALNGAVERQLISDVPLGFFLSGGIDSSLLLAVVREMGHNPSSFTIEFAGSGHGVARANEGEIARAVAERLGVPFHSIVVDEATMRDTLPRMMAAMDQPLADPACLPLLLLAEFARKDVTVCISGDGGDELFAGYPRHQLAPLRANWARLPGPVRSLGRSVAGLLPQTPSTGWREALRKVRVGHGLVDAEAYVQGPFADVLPATPSLEPWNHGIGKDARALMAADLAGQLAGQMLPKTDNMTMAASLECRVPLLDLELVELAAQAPLAWKREARIGKVPLRQLLARHLPREITDRPKHGFRVPLTSWFGGPLAGELRERFARRADVFDALLPNGLAASVLDDHLAGRAEHSVRIWALLALDSWIERTAPATDYLA
jgi:asparagine synthase (glutamine-hydrolysing)